MLTECCRTIRSTIEEVYDVRGEDVGIARYGEHIATDESLLSYTRR